MIGLVVAVGQGNEDAHVVFAGQDLDRGSSKLGSDLVKAARSDTSFGAGHMEGTDGRVMRSLLGKVRDCDRLLGRLAMLGHRERDGGCRLVALGARL